MILVLEIVLLLCEVALAWFILGLVTEARDLMRQARASVEDLMYRKVEPLRKQTERPIT